MNIRTFQPDDEAAQAAVFNAAAAALPGFKPAAAADVRKRTAAPAFDPATRFYAEDGGRVVGYCVLEPGQGRVSFPWCVPGAEAAAPALLDAAVRAAKARGLAKLFAAYRRDWEPVLRFFADHGFAHARDVINYWSAIGDMPTLLDKSVPVEPLLPEDVPALARAGRGVLRLPEEELEAYFFENPHFPASAVRVLRARGTGLPYAVGLGLDRRDYADVRKVDPLAPCFRLGAFGTEGLNTKRVNGLFSFVALEPERAAPAALTLLSALSEEMTDGSVDAFAAQCPSDVKYLVLFYSRYFKEQGRFPIFERAL
ncbi:Uncharacterized protein OS=Singulisphaera acidiphila (strain ATCC BAA-1392 / DSM 18658 / VKM B-2454 / MOB10) GN=Sinac_5816 PE=4 SV=1 [Gemmataceae bacterium]|nr:Uncharacterized protein OS=Singulisphaera acidiphila (strain ATCC BAA-1392 / DSM 18658 / VKM B-2454 / MOB10) GN=Sinac_5816 PE=4 SV=1 [Gemmataceae bacterium]VTU00429.1 Uncharacterized protein OS=Singulisphaera acidiphila (strain ATCC BAA-1392 / DSM 18658 / VKM B-2454 / MOB10) GN=Sinac_5816 PE=4 SV=1 [Gemmataceae bacterium]